MDAQTAQITAILRSVESGETPAERLMPLVYEVLREMAARRIDAQPPGGTLQATALVHEAYLRLFAGDDPSWKDRDHFYSAAAQAMRHILVDHARKRLAAKRGGGWSQVTLVEADAAGTAFTAEEFLRLDGALEKLERIDERKYRLVHLRFFAGLTIEEVGNSLGISPATVKRDWQFAKTWLYREMKRDEQLDE